MSVSKASRTTSTLLFFLYMQIALGQADFHNLEVEVNLSKQFLIPVISFQKLPSKKPRKTSINTVWGP